MIAFACRVFPGDVDVDVDGKVDVVAFSVIMLVVLVEASTVMVRAMVLSNTESCEEYKETEVLLFVIRDRISEGTRDKEIGAHVYRRKAFC